MQVFLFESLLFSLNLTYSLNYAIFDFILVRCCFDFLTYDGWIDQQSSSYFELFSTLEFWDIEFLYENLMVFIIYIINLLISMSSSFLAKDLSFLLYYHSIFYQYSKIVAFLFMFLPKLFSLVETI